MKLMVIWALVVLGWTVAMTALAWLATLVLNQVLAHVGGVEQRVQQAFEPQPDDAAA